MQVPLAGGIRLIDNKRVSQFWMSDFIDLFGIECD